VSALPEAAFEELVTRRDKLLAELVDRDKGEAARIRRAAASVLAGSDSQLAAEALKRAMADDDSIVRLVAATALGRRGNTEAVAYLVGLLSHKEAKIRTPAADALGTLGAKALDELIEQLQTSLGNAKALAQWEVPLSQLKRKQDPTSEDKQKIAELERAVAGHREKAPDRHEKHIAWGLCTGIGSIAAEIEDDAFPAVDLAVHLTQAARCHYADVRRAAVNGLGNVRHGKAIAALLGALKDEDETVRWYAAAALEKHGAPGARALTGALKDEAVAAIAAKSLARIGDADALQAMLERLPDAKGETRAALVWSLGELLRRHDDSDHKTAAQQALREASQLADDPETARLASYALDKKPLRKHAPR
jgi:HEAT repeat protein